MKIDKPVKPAKSTVTDTPSGKKVHGRQHIDNLMQLMTHEKGAVKFEISEAQGSKVFVAGTFNNWDQTAKKMHDKKGDGVYAATLNLPAGDHEYKFLIDGTWCADPEGAARVQNKYGTHNSVKRVV